MACGGGDVTAVEGAGLFALLKVFDEDGTMGLLGAVNVFLLRLTAKAMPAIITGTAIPIPITMNGRRIIRFLFARFKSSASQLSDIKWIIASRDC